MRGLRARALTALLVAAACAVAAATPAQARRYVALGDSYSSGVGTRDYSLNRPCQRGPYAYPVLLRRALRFDRFAFRACGGAKTGDVPSRQLTSMTRDTDVVTISIGGNDARFSAVVRQCAKPWPERCWADIKQAEDFIRRDLPGRLRRVYRAIRRRAPRSVVAAVGYPRIFSGRDECNAAARISPDEQRRLNAVADVLADVTRDQAQRSGFRFVDPRGAFTGHGVCSRDEWVNGLSRPVSESYHPNREGHAAYARLLAAALR